MAILTIDRQYGSGGCQIGQMVSERLGYHYVDKQQLYKSVEVAGERWGGVAREYDEICPTLWEQYDWQYRGYVALVEASVLAHASESKTVIIGRGGYFLLQEIPFCLRVRIVASLEVRLERTMAREHLTREAAIKLIEQMDGDRDCFCKVNYGHSWKGKKLYDIVLNTSTLTFEQVVNIINAALIDKDSLATPVAQEMLVGTALAHRLKARIVTDPRLLVPTLKVHFVEKTILVSGIIHNPKELCIIQELANEICGDYQICLKLRRRV